MYWTGTKYIQKNIIDEIKELDPPISRSRGETRVRNIAGFNFDDMNDEINEYARSTNFEIYSLTTYVIKNICIYLFELNMHLLDQRQSNKLFI